MYRLKQKIIYNQLPSSVLASYADADGASLKVAIYFLSHVNVSKEELVANLSISEMAADRAINYWIENEFIVSSDSETAAVSGKSLTHNDMSKAVLQNPEISVLLQESQQILGRELPLSESRILIEIYQNLLPSVYGILNLESYWASKVPGKKVLNETLYSAREWNNLNIKTEEDCEKQIKEMERNYNYIKQVAAVMSADPDSFTRKERKTIISWLVEYDYDPSFVSEVLLRKSDATIPYINTVLKNWNKKGYRTVLDTRDVPSNITDLSSGDELSPLFKSILRKQQGL